MHDLEQIYRSIVYRKMTHGKPQPTNLPRFGQPRRTEEQHNIGFGDIHHLPTQFHLKVQRLQHEQLMLMFEYGFEIRSEGGTVDFEIF